MAYFFLGCLIWALFTAGSILAFLGQHLHPPLNPVLNRLAHLDD